MGKLVLNGGSTIQTPGKVYGIGPSQDPVIQDSYMFQFILEVNDLVIPWVSLVKVTPTVR